MIEPREQFVESFFRLKRAIDSLKSQIKLATEAADVEHKRELLQELRDLQEEYDEAHGTYCSIIWH
jgi:hypothetical protein